MDKVKFKHNEYTDGEFPYTCNYILFIKSEELSEDIQNKILENSKIEVRIYANLMGSLDDKILYFIPSVYDKEKKSITQTIQKLKNWLDKEDLEKCQTVEPGTITINTEKLLDEIKKKLVVVFNRIIPLADNDDIKATLKFKKPWLIEQKVIRKEKLKRLKSK